jgi:hypothetical protein
MDEALRQQLALSLAGLSDGMPPQGDSSQQGVDPLQAYFMDRAGSERLWKMLHGGTAALSGVGAGLGFAMDMPGLFAANAGNAVFQAGKYGAARQREQQMRDGAEMWSKQRY